MKKLNAIGMKRIVVVVAGVVALTSFGETYDPYKISSDISKVDKTLSPVSDPLSKAKGQTSDSKSFSESLKKAVEKAKAAIETSKKVTKWRNDNEKLNSQRDNLKTANSLPAILKLNIAKKREEANTQ